MYMNKHIKKALLPCLISFLMLLAFAPSTSAELAFANATISLTIINNNPVISSTGILPAEPYPDSELECKVDFFDEVKKDAKVIYTWRSNGRLLGDETSRISGVFEPGDKIDCVAYVVDSAGLSSKPEAASVVISDVQASTATIKTALGVIGVDVNAEKTVELQKNGLASVTGYAVSDLNRQGLSTMYVLIIVLGLLVLINVNIFLRLTGKRKSKTRS